MSIQFSGPIIVGTPADPPTGVELKSLTDVSIVSPLSGQALIYNAGALVWQNQSLGSAVYSYLNGNLIPGSGVNLTFTPGSPGTVTVSANLQPSDVTAALGYSPINKAGDIVSGSYNFSGGTLTNISYEDFAVQSSAPSYLAGRLFYLGGTTQALCYYNDEAETIMNIGQETWIRVRNTSGSTIAAGTPVYISGNNSSLPTVLPANANSASTADVIGIACHSIENNTNGYIVSYGLVNNLNTNSYTPGAALYLATSAGQLTATAPTTPNFVVPVGIVVIQNSTTGSILVDIRSFLKTAVNMNITPAGGVTATNSQQAIYDLDTSKLSRDGSQAMTAALSMGGFKITNVATPTTASDVATKQYVDTQVVGTTPVASCQVATTVALPSCTASGSGVGKTLTATANGALTVDGVAVSVGNRVLVKNQNGAGAHADNGIYDVTATGNAGAPFVLTRSTDFDQTAEVVSGSTTFIENGTGNSSTSWTMITTGTITVDTTAIQFTLSSRADAIIAGTGLSLSTNTISVNLGAGITQLPTNEVGVDVHTSGGLFTTVDNSANSTVTASQLAVKLDGTTLSKSSNGLKVTSGGITGTELNASVAGAGLAGGAGTSLSVGTASSSRIVINSDNIDLATTGISAGNFNVLTIDAYGRATTGFLRSLTAPAAGITVTNATGVTGNPTLALADDLGSLEGLSTTGLSVRTATSSWSTRSITVSGIGLSITNGDGVAGNPTITSNATTANIGSTLVARDASGNFVAGTINATLIGNAASASAAPWSGITGKPSTIAGYGITDAITTGTGGTISSSGKLILVKAASVAAGGTAPLEIQNTGGTGDGNVAAIGFHCPGTYAINLHLRNDGYFGLGGWSSPTWRWYSGPDGSMFASGDVIAYSDPRLKQDIVRIDNALEKVLLLDGVEFTWKTKKGLTKSGSRDYGVLSDQVEKVSPLAVNHNGMEIEGEKYKMVAYDKLIPLLIESIKDLNSKIEDLKSQLEKRN